MLSRARARCSTSGRRTGPGWRRSTSAASRRRSAWSSCRTSRSVSTRSCMSGSHCSGWTRSRPWRRSRCSASSASSTRSSATPGPSAGRRTPAEEVPRMKYIDEFNDPELAKRLLDDIHATVTQPWAIMEVCGGQTHSIIRHGIDQLIPDEVEMIHGPGCPVCVTPLELIDKALEIASRPGRDLLLVRRHAARARQRPRPVPDEERGRRRPGRVLAARRAQARPREPRPRGGLLRHRLRDDRPAQRDGGLPGASGSASQNFSMLVSHVRVPPAIEAIMQSPTCRVQGVPRRRPRLQRDGHAGVPAAGRALFTCRSW